MSRCGPVNRCGPPNCINNFLVSQAICLLIMWMGLLTGLGDKSTSPLTQLTLCGEPHGWYSTEGDH